MAAQPIRASHSALRSRRVMTLAVAGLLAATLLGGAGSSPATPATQAAVDTATPSEPARPAPTCSPPSEDVAGCMTLVATDSEGRPLTASSPEQIPLRPFAAGDLQDAYNLPSDLLGGRQTVALVVPYDNPNAAADLAVYRDANGLSPCTSDSSCLRKIDQRGGTDYPPPHAAWGLNIAAGLQMVSAACPNCRLLLVEADDPSVENTGIAVEQAAQMGPDVIVTMYAAQEHDGQSADAEHYDHPGIPIVAASGNSGFPAGGIQLVPAAYDTVIAVGGTTLYRDPSPRGWTEVAWSGSSSGCSLYVDKPAWQRDTLCARRTVADVAAVADLNTPVAVYDTYGYPGWMATGGTPVSAALVGAIYALAGNADSIDPGRHLYRHRRHLFDVRSGSTGYCGDSYLCSAVKGYDGPTGLGTPNGIGAF